MKNLLIAIFVFTAHYSVAQNTTRLLLMNGKYLDVYNFDDSSQVTLNYDFDKNFYKRERLDRKTARRAGDIYSIGYENTDAEKIPVVIREGAIDRSDVFAATLPSGVEKIFYVYDEPLGNYLEESQMRAFVYGERDARNGERGQIWFYSGMAIGGAASYALRNSVFVLAVPPVFALSAKIPTINIKEKYIADKQYLYNDDYASGYESYARSKNTIEALKGSAIGTLLGIIAYSIVDNNR